MLRLGISLGNLIDVYIFSNLWVAIGHFAGDLRYRWNILNTWGPRVRQQFCVCNSFVLTVCAVSFVFVYVCGRARVSACLVLFVLASENFLVVASLRSSLIESQHRAPPALCLLPAFLPGRNRGLPRAADPCYILLGWQGSTVRGG